MRARSTATGLATLGLILGSATVLGSTVLAGTALAATPTVPAAGSTCTEGQTRPSLQQSNVIQKCTNGTWVTYRTCSGLKPVVYYDPGTKQYICAPRGVR